MAVVENAGVELGKSVGSNSANRNPETATTQDGGVVAASNDQDQSKLNSASAAPLRHRIDQSMYVMVTPPPNGNSNINGNGQVVAAQLGSFDHVANHHHQQQRSNGGDFQMSNGDHHHDVDRDMRELRELFSKLNPMAEEFVPPSLANGHGLSAGFVNMALMMQNRNLNGQANGFPGRRRNNQGKRRINSRTSLAQREDRIRRTVYVSDIDQQVTEEQLAALFVTCGQVVDCRICGDPNSVLRFAFIEFTDEDGARVALSLAGTMLGFYPVRVLPSKTAIAPVNPTFLPRTEDEREMCARTIYCTNIDKKVTQADVKLFFESVCGEVYRLRLLGDYHHSTRIAFVEFVMAESAIAALNCSGVVLGSLPIRVSPSKTPVRPRAPRLPIH
ncbi:polyadenylate-binding protein-interacting protein 11-like [Malus sylvestris]|uniref:polyadenylate-binding protein-interacting protein 11-like n=1 Tax=Malus sylvestris TaxID=3752 RepID=UPI0021ACD27D|nr:polyadenylate-binding protein-interacting protein 11-like [Malus sylvestris]